MPPGEGFHADGGDGFHRLVGGNRHPQHLDGFPRGVHHLHVALHDLNRVPLTEVADAQAHLYPARAHLVPEHRAVALGEAQPEPEPEPEQRSPFPDARDR